MSGDIAGSGIHFGRPHATRHVEHAVAAAMEAAQLSQVMGLFLFLTDDHIPELKEALRAAARVAGCTQVFGCSAMGLFTDRDWTIDASAAAALVVGNGVSIGLDSPADTRRTRIALGTPRDVSEQWLRRGGRRLGAIASDSLGRGPFQIWNHGRVAGNGVATCILEGVDLDTRLAQGVEPLTPATAITDVDGFQLRRLDGAPALDVLMDALPTALQRLDRIPLHMLFCGVTNGDPASAIRDNRFRLEHIVSSNPEDRSITLADQLTTDDHLFWALRDRGAAQRQFQRALEAEDTTPDFALMFSCLGRGPGFYGGRDLDVETLRERYPDMPFAGFYGNGEIAPLGDGSNLFNYSAAIGLCRRRG